MANKLKGEIEVQVGEGDEKKTLVFRLGMNELIGLQDALGYGEKEEEFLVDLDTGKARRGLKKTRLVAKHMLLSRQPDTSDEQAGAVLSELGMVRFNELFQETLKWAMPEKEPGAAKGKEPSPSPGKPS